MSSTSLIPYSEITSIGLYVLGDEDNRRDAHVNVVHQDLFRNNLPHKGGPYDAHMGTTDFAWKCETCLNSKTWCPGHPGVLNLNYPVQSPLFLKDIAKWLKVICFNCGKLLIEYEKLPVSSKNVLGEYVKIMRSKDKNVTCVHCGSLHPNVVRDRNDNVRIITEWYKDKKKEASLTLFPHKIAQIFDKITDETVRQMGKDPLCHPRKFIISALRVPANTIRPDMKKIGGGRSKNNDVTVLLQTIIKVNDSLPADIPKTIDDNLEKDIDLLGLAVFEMIKGSSANSTKRSIAATGKKQLMAIAKRLPRKFGRVRRNLMGRRVNNMARSFITCDPNRKITEVGVPIRVARNIQIEEYVRPYNYQQMQVYFMNGTDVYPGCNKIKKASTGKTHWVGNIDRSTFRLEYGDVIHRDLVTGDIAGFNRQPSLLISNITAMNVVVMKKTDTITMNVLACPFFNADFDGDAMNLLFSLSKRTTNEIGSLASPAQFFIAYKDAKPMIGEAQDSVIGTALLTDSRVRMDKFHAMKMFEQVPVYHDFGSYPASHVFTGRDIITILLQETDLKINFNRRAAIYRGEQSPFRSYNDDDINVEIDRGVLKSGILDKTSIGEGAQGGVFHIINNKYGPDAALEAAWYVQQLALAYAYNAGITVSVGDFLVREESARQIHDIESRLIADSMQVTRRLNAGKIIPPIGQTITEHYEALQISALKPGDEFWKPIITGIDYDHNNLYKLIFHGSKGKPSNLLLIATSVGQIDINGERMPEKFGGRALPHFTKFDDDPRSRGYVANSYITGLSCPEFLLHAQEARYQLINKALSTSITGMQNRMSIKNLESMVIDNQRKVVKGQNIIQLVYGADGVDPRYLEKVQFPTVGGKLSDKQFKEQYHSDAKTFGAKFKGKGVQSLLDEEFEQLKVDRAQYRRIFLKWEASAGKMFSDTISMPVNIGRIIADICYNMQLKPGSHKELDPVKTVEGVRGLCKNIIYAHMNNIQERKGTPPPPHMQHITMLLQILIRSYLNTANLANKGITDKALEFIIKRVRLTYSRTLISYGKCVGILAAQSISEPMTQMVLDSHHTSGAGSTRKQGMFRIKEILGARDTDKMKSPSMFINVLPQFRENKLKVMEIANYIEMMPLRQFVKEWQVFYEKYGEPVHPSYVDEKRIFKEFEKYNKYLVQNKPKDLAPWCMRVVLDKSKMILKQMKMETIYSKIRQVFPFSFIVYTTDNAPEVIMRIYVRNIIAKRSTISTDQMVELINDILDTVIRGVSGIKATYVNGVNISEPQDDGTIITKQIFNIYTDGTNLEEILENPYIDPCSTYSDSIIEMTKVYGLGAGRNRIVHELRYQVDAASYRHYGMYADEMTFTGGITSIDRYGSAKRDASIMLRISDASPIAVIEEAAVNAQSDQLQGVSPPIMVGKKPRIGDLYNSFVLDEDFVKKNVQNLDDILDDL